MRSVNESTGVGDCEADPVPSVSVVMPVRDAAATLTDAIRSVQSQTFSGWELIIFDDGSKDASRRIAEDHAAGDQRIVVMRSEAGQGAAAARNRAISVAKGKYVAFLDADDLWLPEKLERQIAFMRQTGAALTFTAYCRRDSAGRERVRQVPKHVDYETLLRGNVIGCLTAVYDREKLGRKYMPEIRRRHDFALWLEIVMQSGPAQGLNETLAVHRVRPGSLSANRIAATIDTWRMYRERIGLSRWQAGRNLAAHLMQRVFR
ncbi:Putative teichuronic acid biosynthesis glycosyltransferase TuaG [Defluviimonas aquaemixtae]|uniref:Teichuronic acid biosynthesis glycosyltransferase TuaG n=1 Tax=Albidovulum aquaemixtae TaxID=1542388 RepID=A0A2R8B2R8_9RHOB|nr:glycosyltransferase family 2 protein [Defluviimonas aquaemixtae]SPH16877.1 Putative teichuronic acid biosynthesis glycosyltransferase TuaG [Defluviimonas aquaemixtae]